MEWYLHYGDINVDFSLTQNTDEKNHASLKLRSWIKIVIQNINIDLSDYAM